MWMTIPIRAGSVPILPLHSPSSFQTDGLMHDIGSGNCVNNFMDCRQFGRIRFWGAYLECGGKLPHARTLLRKTDAPDNSLFVVRGLKGIG
jgi:hypothetical protein